MEFKLLKKYWATPKPDIEKFKKVIKREKNDYLPFAELGIDEEIIRYISENYFGIKWVSKSENREIYWKNIINFYYKMGYDYVMVGRIIDFPSEMREGKDIAFIQKEKRYWTSNKGPITCWEDFENYKWPEIKDENFWIFEFISLNLPEGMGILACPLGGGIFEYLINILIGYETFCYLLYDNLLLIIEIIKKIEEYQIKCYKIISQMKNVVGFFQGDDMGYKTGTLVSPQFLKKYILPSHKKMSEIAHQNNLLYILHSCGNIESLMEDLIEEVKIDGKHSFEDEIISVSDFKKKYGKRVSIVGGIDINKLSKWRSEKLKKYISNIIEECYKDGGYLLGSGNTITNYIPIKNYFLMLEEGLKYRNGT